MVTGTQLSYTLQQLFTFLPGHVDWWLESEVKIFQLILFPMLPLTTKDEVKVSRFGIGAKISGWWR